MKGHRAGGDGAARAFVARLRARGLDVDDTRGAAAFGAALEQARAAWPTLSLAPAAFAAHLAEHVAAAADGDEPTGADATAALASFNVEDLYLACACAHGVPPALAAFDERVLSAVPRYVARFDRGPAFADEIVQTLRERLLVAVDRARPRIAEYGGRGALRAWVKVAAVRLAIDLVRARGEAPHDDPDAAEALGAAPSPELQLLKERYKDAFQQALNDAIAERSAKQRNLLRLHYLDGFSLDRLAVSYGVHRATVARWLADAKDEIVRATHAKLGAQLSLSPSEIASIATLVRSQLQISVRYLFDRNPRPPR